jgi:hypothetical protein
VEAKSAELLTFAATLGTLKDAVSVGLCTLNQVDP